MTIATESELPSQLEIPANITLGPASLSHAAGRVRFCCWPQVPPLRRISAAQAPTPGGRGRDRLSHAIGGRAMALRQVTDTTTVPLQAGAAILSDSDGLAARL